MRINFFYSKLLCVYLILITIAFSNISCAQKFDELAKTPQMGWNSWNKFACQINEQLIKEMADAMIKTGMKSVGYEYVNIDDCWHGERGPMGNIQPDARRFPSGIKALADYIHSKGLKLGIYSDAGTKTCAGYPGSRGYELQDAITYASWGVDYVKYDWCNTKGQDAEESYRKMRDAIHNAGRPMLFSICEWGTNNPTVWAPKLGHSWRTTSDIYPCWDCELGNNAWSALSIIKILDLQTGLRNFSGPGHWNDMDMLEVGNRISDSEGRAHFTIWAMMNSPLIAGNDLRSMSDETLKTLTNKDVIALNQDELGIQALRVSGENNIEVFVKPLADEQWAIMFLNRNNQPVKYTFKWADNEIVDDLSGRKLQFAKTKYTWTNLWGKTTGTTEKNINQIIPAHDVLVFRLRPKK